MERTLVLQCARHIGQSLAFFRERMGAVRFIGLYLASGLFVFGIQASPLDAPTLVAQEYQDTFLAKSEFSKSRASIERGVFAYLRSNMKGISHYRTVQLTRHIIRVSREHRFHPGLILSVMRVESGFRAWAVSPRGAIGLMQIMPDTGQWLAARYGMVWEGPAMLLDEEVNITMGVRYLAYLKAKYSGDLKRMLSAYNRGPGAVDEEVANGEDGKLEYYNKVRQYLPSLVFWPAANPKIAQVF